MISFELKNHAAKLAHFNARSEMNGEDRVAAADVKLELALTTEHLVMFGPELRSSWFDGSNGQSRLRNPKLEGPFGWEDEIRGATLTIHRGLGGPKSDLNIGDCLVNGFKLTPQEGGTVLLSLRVQCHPDEKQAGRLYAMTQTDVEISLQPAQSELPGV